MDSFEKRIEDYKRELMKYAKRNGTVYSGSNDGFEPAEIKEESAKAVEGKAYLSQYVNNRPMPPEYTGGEDPTEAETANVQPQRPGEQTAPEADAYSNYEDFISKNTQLGKLRVQTYAATQVFPIQNARVIVEKEFENETHTFAEEYTDIDGVADEIILPTKSKSLSISPGTVIPYSTYTVKVTHPQFTPITFHNVPIFESIESLQPAAMLPLSSPPAFGDIYEEEPNL